MLVFSDKVPYKAIVKSTSKTNAMNIENVILGNCMIQFYILTFLHTDSALDL